ncbi:MAG TPA: hypothetical protein VE999_18070, partial [Gemmataceae bacterium]|nr:hypothetical protein [Gemmataceae bacterium]
NDRSYNSMERLTQSIEKQAAAYGKTGVERLVAERDRLIKKLGDEQGMVDRVRAAYERMIEAEKKKGEHGGGIEELGSKFKEFIENPIAGVKEAASGLLEKLGPIGSAITAGAGAFTAFAAAGYEAAKSLGEYGVQVRDVEVRTGLSAKEVGQFGFAARAAGQDVSVFERMMRGLTQAVMDNSAEGEKARGWLTKFGVDLADVRDGSASTAEVLEKIAEGLEHSGNEWERKKAALDLFKRAGIETLPVLMELNENLKIAREQGFGPNEADIARFIEYQRQVTILETKWEGLKRTFKEGLVIEVNFAGNAAKWLWDHLPGGGVDLDDKKWEREMQLAEDIRRANAARGKWGPYPLTGVQDLMRKRMQALEKLDPFAAFGPGEGQRDYRSPEVRQKLELAAEYQRQIDQYQQGLAKAAENERNARRAAANEAVRRYEAERSKDPEYRLKQAEQELAKLAKPQVGVSSQEDVEKYRAAEQRVEQLKALIEHTQKLREEETRLEAFEKQMYQKDMDPVARIFAERDELVKAGADWNRATAAAISGADVVLKKQEEEQSKRWQELTMKAAADSGKFWDKQWEEVYKEATARGKQVFEDLKQQVAQVRADLARSDEETFGRMRAAGAHAERVLGIAGGRDDLATLREQLAIRQAVREQELAIKEQHDAIYDVDRERFNAEIENLQDRYEYEEKILELKRREFDEVERTAQSLAHTLLTNPGDFGKQLASTLHEAILKPITEGIGSMMARAITPLIFGSDGQGGIAGIFRGIFGGGKQDPMKAATDLNTAVTAQNSAAIASLTAVMAAVMGMSAPAIAAPGGVPGGISLPTISIPAAPGASGAASPGAAPADILNLQAMHSAASTNPLGMILGANQRGGTSGIYSLFTKDGFSKMLSNLKGTVWNQQAWEASDSNFWGGVQAVAKSPAAGAAGMMLAMNGLFGSSRGTWGGIAQSTAGGALIGEQIGGPLGAAIGAGAGFLAGLGEKLFGVESPENEAIRLVKQLYSINIDMQTAKQIVSIAQQKYAGHVGIAVRDPDVRKMLMLYSQATGQKMPLSAGTPQSASLVEMGGRLYQQATYVNGMPYTFQSNLPVLGGYATGTYPSPGPMMLQVNVQGQGAAQFVAGQVVTPEFVQAQWSSAA